MINSHSKTEEDIFKQYFHEMPSSVKIIQYGGIDSTSGANIYIFFEISPIDFKNLIKDNNYLFTKGDLLMRSTYSVRNKQGNFKSINGLDLEKATAKQLGIIPDELYIKNNSTYSHYWLIIADKSKTKIYFRYYRV